MEIGHNSTGTSSREKCRLSALLHIGRSYEATDPQDKVYGILGLLRGFEVFPQLEVRYDRTVSDLYMRTAELIYKEENLNFLGLVEVNRSSDQKDSSSCLPGLQILLFLQITYQYSAA